MGGLDEPGSTTAPPIDVYVVSFVGDNPVTRIAADTGVATAVHGTNNDGLILAVDGQGSVYLQAGLAHPDSDILKVTAGGARTVLAPGYLPESLAADWRGTVYAIGTGPAIKIPADGTPPLDIWTGAGIVGYPSDIAVDGFSNVYILVNAPVQVVKLPAGGGPQIVYSLAGILKGILSATGTFAVDPQGEHVYAFDSLGVLQKIPLAGGPTTSINTDVNGPSGIAVDGLGNVYIADSFNDRVVMVPAATGVQVTIWRTMWPTRVALQPSRRHLLDPPDLVGLDPPDLVGKLFGPSAADGGGWLVIGDHFIPIPPRSPLLQLLARTVIRHLGRAVQNPELAERLRAMRNIDRKD